MDIDDIISVGHVFLDLADGFQERQGFDISHSTADFGDNDIRIVIFADTEDTVFNFIGDMGDNLYGGSQILTFSFFIDDRLVDFACRHVGGFGQIFVNETFIVSQIKIRFRAIISDKDFTMLVRTHGAGININIRVKFLNGNFVPSVFQKTAERSGGNTFSQR